MLAFVIPTAGAYFLAKLAVALCNQKWLQDEKKELEKGFKVFLFVLTFPFFWFILFFGVALFQILAP